jgi:Pyruvate/2-oxoacid:ferredoxin oxidoreductase delta subunit
MKVTRRGLFDLFRPRSEDPLHDFYARRAPPQFPGQVKLREGLPEVETAPHGRPPRARISESRCLAWTTSFCTVCVERCPSAIVVTGGRPRIVAEACDGCGVCVEVCPAPLRAIELVAR